MTSLADITETPLLLASCKRCGELLNERVRFCPECGKDQSIADEPADPSVTLNSVPGPLGDGPPAPLLATPSLALPFDQVQAAMRLEVVPLPPQDGYPNVLNTSIGFVRPGALLHHEAQAAGNDRHVRWADRVTPNRLVIGVMAVLVAGLLLALGHEAFVNWQGDVGSQMAVRGRQGPSPRQVEGPVAAAPASLPDRPDAASAGPARPAPAAPQADRPAAVMVMAPVAAPAAVAVSASAAAPPAAPAASAPTAPAASAPAAVAADSSTAPPPLPVAASAATAPTTDTGHGACTGARAALALCQAN